MWCDGENEERRWSSVVDGQHRLREGYVPSFLHPKQLFIFIFIAIFFFFIFFIAFFFIVFVVAVGAVIEFCVFVADDDDALSRVTGRGSAEDVKETGDVGVEGVHRPLDGREGVIVFGVEVGPSLVQKHRRPHLPDLRGKVQRRLALVVLGVWVSTSPHQQRYHVHVPIQHRQVQCCVSFMCLAVDAETTGLQDPEDLWKVFLDNGKVQLVPRQVLLLRAHCRPSVVCPWHLHLLVVVSLGWPSFKERRGHC
mmetsp:Transcript_24844/g.41709  ORF Transcript_24844/g.41709 Transcript_24844/m.41709 type:complete len:252 (-) Transcript_24844:80-835(-)